MRLPGPTKPAPEASAQRLDVCVAGLFDLSRSRARHATSSPAPCALNLAARFAFSRANTVSETSQFAEGAALPALPTRAPDSLQLIYEDQAISWSSISLQGCWLSAMPRVL